LFSGCLPGFLRPETVTELWKIAANTEGKSHKHGGYGLGWVVIPEKQDFGACRHQLETVLHSGKKKLTANTVPEISPILLAKLIGNKLTLMSNTPNLS